MDLLKDKILEQNSNGWNIIADNWFGTTALPTYGPFTPTENELSLFDNISGKRVLDIGCGSGHSLLYMAKNKAEELWGVDISASQIKNAEKFLNNNGFSPKLFVSPMEENPGIPLDYFDIVYSIYALGWTVDIDKTISRISSYLKTGGIFIFSWDHPIMQCFEMRNSEIIFKRSYQKEPIINFEKGGQPMTLHNWKLSSYINALAKAGMKIERLIEQTDQETLDSEAEFSEKYYSKYKSKFIPASFIIKAVKL